MTSIKRGEIKGVWSAPGRVNLIGEHTDYNGGLALPFAIDRRTRATVQQVDGRGLHVSTVRDGDESTARVSSEELVPGRLSGWVSYVAGVAWALDLAEQLERTALAISLQSTVPVGSGLSSSAALMCSVATALNEVFTLGYDSVRLAHLTQRVENDFVGAPTGGMDQRVSLMGKKDHALLFDVQADSTQLVPFNPATVGLTILAVDTLVTHANVDGGYGARRADCERAAQILQVAQLRDASMQDLAAAKTRFEADGIEGTRAYLRARHVISEIDRVEAMVDALSASDWETAGRLMTEAHASIRDDFQASCPELDTAVTTMIEGGAMGARMTGGGFGGTAIGLLPADQTDVIADRVALSFAEAGFDQPQSFVVTPSDGACRDS